MLGTSLELADVVDDIDEVVDIDDDVDDCVVEVVSEALDYEVVDVLVKDEVVEV